MTTCILPCISCGLLYVGAAHTGLQYISTEVTGMYRRVVGNMANITGMTHAWEGLQNALSLMPAHDIIYQACWGALHRSRNALDRCGSGPVRELVVPQVLHVLTVMLVSLIRILQRHLTRTHNRPRQVQRRFKRWQTLTDHACFRPLVPVA